MPLPEFTDSGDLPVGIHRASIAELLARFGTSSDRRTLLSRRLERVYQLAVDTGHLNRFVVFGSFVTDKHAPNDVDVFMIMDDDFDLGSVVGEHKHCSPTTAPHRIILGQVCSGCAAWLHSAENRQQLRIGKSNVMEPNVASLKLRRKNHD